MKRREWWANGSVLFSTESSAKVWSRSNAEVIPIREVLPDDPDPDWVDELIDAMCEYMDDKPRPYKRLHKVPWGRVENIWKKRGKR